jgi:glyoxylase-like metal-dependent hydrolase (beta-lactamase superfamily II)
MIKVEKFVFNPFQVNTYILWDETRECVIIDPGCADAAEQEEITEFIAKEGLKPVRLLSTHSHIDHIAGNVFISKHYGLKLEAHRDGKPFIDHSKDNAFIYGFEDFQTMLPDVHIQEGDAIRWGNSELQVIDTPGHAAGSVCFINHPQRFVIAGDVLFYQSIGRTDLPSGDYDLLIRNITTKLLTLPPDYTVYSGHGPETTIGFEAYANPFLGSI